VPVDPNHVAVTVQVWDTSASLLDTESTERSSCGTYFNHLRTHAPNKSFPKDRYEVQDIETNKTKSASCTTRAAVPRTPLMTSMACFGHVSEDYEQIQTVDIQNEYEPTLPPVEEDGTLAH
jgi:hypothetical protein